MNWLKWKLLFYLARKLRVGIELSVYEGHFGNASIDGPNNITCYFANN